MNSRLLHWYLKPGGLYAPQKSQGTSEPIPRSDNIGVLCVAAGQAQKGFSLTITTVATATLGARSGSASGLVDDWKNTVLQGLVIETFGNLAMYPRCDGSTERFPATGLLSMLDAAKILAAYCFQAMPRKAIQYIPDKVVTLAMRLATPLAAHLSTIDFVADRTELSAKKLAFGCGHKLAQAKIDSNNITFLAMRRSACLNPKNYSCLGQCASLNEARVINIEPLSQYRCGFKGKSYTLTLDKPRQLHEHVKQRPTILNNHVNKLGVKDCGTREMWARSCLAEGLR
jgi:hypothetical protein